MARYDRYVHWGLLTALGVVLGGLCSGCGGDAGSAFDPLAPEQGPVAAPEQVQAGLLEQGQAGLPTITALAEREASIMDTRTQYPGDELAVSEGVAIGGGKMYLQSPADGMAWAIWGWRQLDYGYHYPLNAVIAQGGAGGRYWLGVPDFTRNQWRFAGPYTALETTINLQPVSPLRANSRGVSYLAIVCCEGDSAAIESLTLELDWFTHQPGAHTPLWTSAWGTGDPENLIYVFWPYSEPQCSFHVLKWRAGADPAAAELITKYPDDDPYDPGEQLYFGYRDSDIEPGTYYQYRAIAVDQEQTAGQPGPIALAYCGDTAGRYDISGRIMFDAVWGLPGIELYIPELELFTTTDLTGEYCFPALPPGSYNLWLTTPKPAQFIRVLAVTDGAIRVADYQYSPQTTPDWNWNWLYPPAEVSAAEISPNTVQVSWSAADYAEEYVVYRSNHLDPGGVVGLYRGTALTITLANEPAGELEYYVQSVQSDRHDYWDNSPLSAPAQLTIPFRGLAPDTIYAVPEQTTATDGEHVRVTVFTNLAANPLAYLNCCRITYESASTIDMDSINVGAPGGGRSDPDGLWALTAPADGILGVPDYMLLEVDLGNGRKGFDFNVTPLNGAELKDATGALYNFEIEVHSDVHFSFLPVAGGMRMTYYSDYDSVEHSWRDCYNYGQPGITLVAE